MKCSRNMNDDLAYDMRRSLLHLLCKLVALHAAAHQLTYASSEPSVNG
jgi:hypothetical protein